jgi:hypothetical protein
MDEILQELIAPMKTYFPSKQPTNENLYEYYPTAATRIVKTGSFIQNVNFTRGQDVVHVFYESFIFYFLVNKHES